MIKNILTAALIILVSGCASQALVDKQVAELKALNEYHKAERKEERAEKGLAAANIALEAAAAHEAESQKGLDESKAALDELLKK